MAEEPQGADVTLTADVSKWEAAMERAKASVSSWSDRVSERFTAARDAIKSRTETIVGYVAQVREKATETGDVAGAVGSVLGGLAGTAIGGPIGTALGSVIGESMAQGIAEAVDFEGIVARFEELTPLVAAQAEEAADAWEGMKFGFNRVWEDIKAEFATLDVEQFFTGSEAEIEQRFEDLANRVGEKVRDLAGQFAVRIADLIDTAVGRFQAPVAAVADWLERVAVQLGVVDTATGEWGDAIRNLHEVGIEVMAALARAVGYVADALKIAGGAIAVTYVAPFLNSISLITKALSELASFGRELPEEFGGGAGGVFAKIEEGVGRVSDRVGKMSERLGKAGIDLIMEGLALESADKFEAWLRENRERLQQLNRRDDEARRMEVPAVPEPDVPTPAAPTRGVEAMLAGSREAVRVLIANEQRGGRADPQERAAKAAEENVKTAREQIRQAKAARDLLQSLVNLAENVGTI